MPLTKFGPRVLLSRAAPSLWLACAYLIHEHEPLSTQAFVRAAGTKTFEQVEAELLNGQKIQGTGTAQEVMTILRKNGIEKDYPLLTSIYKISFENAPVESMLDTLGAYGRLPSQTI